MKFARSLGASFQLTTAVISNTGTCASFSYKATGQQDVCNDQWIGCSGTLSPGQSVRCNFPTVPGTIGACPNGDFTVDLNIHNTAWTCEASGDVHVNQLCISGNQAAGADLCSNGTFYAYLDSTGLPNYVTGGCVPNFLSGNCAGGSDFCCPNGNTPSTSTSCGSGDGTTDSPCVDCTGGC